MQSLPTKVSNTAKKKKLANVRLITVKLLQG